jgi:putative endonuclease
VVSRNWRCRTGEIDIVAKRSGVLVICEVKTRASDRFGSPAHAVTIDKQRRLRRLAMAWMAEHSPREVVIRFDVACVVGEEDSCSVEVIEAAF